jgi:hypothetical protein
MNLANEYGGRAIAPSDGYHSEIMDMVAPLNRTVDLWRYYGRRYSLR